VIRGDVPPSKVLRMLRWSPVDSPFRASVAGGPDRLGWGGPMGVMADVWDVLVAVNTEKGKNPPSHPRYGKAKGGTSLGQMMKNRLGSKGRGNG
jgi:hypothetical protein